MTLATHHSVLVQVNLHTEPHVVYTYRIRHINSGRMRIRRGGIHTHICTKCIYNVE